VAISIHDLRRHVKRCDPFLPLAAGDPAYVPLDEGAPVRGDQTCIDALYRTIALAEDTSCQLFTGFPGAGKTTELKRLEHRLLHAKDLPTFVVFIDFDDYVDRYAPTSVTDVLRVIAYAMDRAATVAEGKDPDKEPGYLRRLFAYLSSADAQLKEIGFEAYGASLMLEIKNNPSFSKRVEVALSGRFQQFAIEAMDEMAKAVERLRKAKDVAAERVVVIADGLEKLTALREEDRTAMEASVESLFVTHRELLHLPCHAIYTFPLWLRFRNAHLGASYGGEPLVLPMVKVRAPDGTPYEPGIAKMSEMVRRRIDDMPAIFGADLEATLRPLVVASGGFPRDLLRMVRTVLKSGDVFPIQPERSERTIRELGRSYADTILGTYVSILREVAATHGLPKQDSSQLALFGHLFERWLILAYRNGEEWYDPHPLVRRALEAMDGAAGR
jgi:hypothetical protein